MANRSSASDVASGLLAAGIGVAAIVGVGVLVFRSRRDGQPPVNPRLWWLPQTPEQPTPVEVAPPQRMPETTPHKPPHKPPRGPEAVTKPDSERLTFLMSQPRTDAGQLPMRFQQQEGPDVRSYSLKDMVERIQAGRRHDVTLRTTGMREGSADYARAFLWKSGITDVYDTDGRRWTLGPESYLVQTDTDDPDKAQYQLAPPKKATAVSTVAVSGNTRGQYGRRSA